MSKSITSSPYSNHSDGEEVLLVSIRLIENVVRAAAANPLRVPVAAALEKYPDAIADMHASGRFDDDIVALIELCLEPLPEKGRERERPGLYDYFGVTITKKRRAPRQPKTGKTAMLDQSSVSPPRTRPAASSQGVNAEPRATPAAAAAPGQYDSAAPRVAQATRDAALLGPAGQVQLRSNGQRPEVDVMSGQQLALPASPTPRTESNNPVQPFHTSSDGRI